VRRPLPQHLKSLRIVLFVGAGLYAIGAVAGMAIGGLDGSALAYVLWVTWPGIAYLVFALRLPLGGRPLFWSIVALQALLGLMALANLLTGTIAGIFQLIIPALSLAFVLRRPAREFLRRERVSA
jgi:hypothetical protein